MDTNSKICCRLLKDGYLHSFEDLFIVLECDETDLPDDDRLEVCKLLRMAESELNRGEFEAGFWKFEEIGKFFAAKELFSRAAHFFEKCKSIAESKSKKTRLLREAYLHLGQTYETLRQFDDSIQNHKLHIRCREKEGREVELMHAHNYLFQAFRLKALDQKQRGKYEDALETLRASVEASREAHNLLGEGENYFEMGHVFEAQEKLDEAITHYRKYLSIALELKHDEAESKAYYAVGNAYRLKKDIILASKYFESFLEKANTTGTVADKCLAERAMGDILSDLSQFQSAYQHYEKNYESSAELGDARSVNNAAVDLGVIQGRLLFEQLQIEEHEG